MTKEEQVVADINSTIKLNIEISTNDISDGYHTFGELYDHRITLFIALCKSIQKFRNCGITINAAEGGKTTWRSKKHSDGELAFGGTWFVLGVSKEEGKQVTYHLPIERWDETDFAEILEKAPEWDGHTAADVLNRLKSL